MGAGLEAVAAYSVFKQRPGSQPTPPEPRQPVLPWFEHMTTARKRCQQCFFIQLFQWFVSDFEGFLLNMDKW
jgi:hypothetical protein